MPGIASKLLIFAAVDGLVLQPLAPKGQRASAPAKVTYSDNRIASILKNENEGNETGKSFEAFGVVGLLNVSKSSFLISITGRRQVAQIQGKPIYCVTDVALTPLTSKPEAEASISRTQRALRKGHTEEDEIYDSGTADELGGVSASISDDVGDDDLQPVVADSDSGQHKRTTSVAEDVISKKGSYGRFAKRWFSRKGWTADQRRNLGMTASDTDVETPNTTESGPIAPADSDIDNGIETNGPAALKSNKAKDVAASLLPKLLRTTQVLFGSSRSFFYSYDYDITRSFMNRRATSSELPLYTQVDPSYFWNRSMVQPFIDVGQDSFILPLMQGFVGQTEFEMDTDPPKPVLEMEKSSMEMVDLSARQKGQADGGVSEVTRESTDTADDDKPSQPSTMKSFLLTLISRRSTKRAGLRYLRRGVDEEGFTANGVETEQILSDPTWKPSSRIYSFVQIRGSIPIFFSQSPYSFKPIPQVQHSDETNYNAFVKHFTNISDRYGSIQVATLVEKHGPETIVGGNYEKYMNRLNESGGIRGSPIGFEWFDFHAICRGMKFENVSLLVEILGKKLDSFGFTVESDQVQSSKQTGVLRTNCMDCLDRTNVVQNSFGRRALEQQLKAEGVDASLQQDQNLLWLNTLWADNGDAISKQYASTAALKGDFTRTRKRDYKGALTDMGLSISRFYTGIVNDYFSQAAIDFLLGNVTSVVFEDFETSLMSRDPAVSMQKMRQQAIETCQKLVIADEQEELLGGWALLTPQIPNTIKSTPFKESILLLTDSGLYSCRFDWNLEKLLSFERVSLDHILSIKYGTYITSTLSSSQTDETRNVGFVVTYKAGKNDIARVNTRSMTSVSRMDTDLLDGTSTSPPAFGLSALIGKSESPTNKVLALKAPPSQSAVPDGHDTQPLSEIEQVKGICSEIERVILSGQVHEAGTETKVVVESGDVISLAEARKSTGILEQLGHGVKKLIWA